MERPGICSVCGGVADPAHTCRMCGMTVCSAHYDSGKGLCTRCLSRIGR